MTIGSHGDVHPFIGLGLALKARGHSISFAANDYFEPLIRRAGFDHFSALGTAEEYQQMANRPELWDRKRGVRVVFESIGRSLSQVYNVAADHHSAYPRDSVVVSSSLCLGARVAQDALHFPMATVHLAPAILRSNVETAKLPGFSLPPWLPLWMKQSIWYAADRFVIDPMIAPSLNQFRIEKGLKTIRRPIKDWWHSPDRVLGFWPEWFAPLQPDWPAQTRLCGFPLYDERDFETLSPTLLQFLAAGETPIAFTPGSAMWRGERFFASAVDICSRLNCRGILLSRSTDHIPKYLPPGVIHVPFAPFSLLLPHVAALVHHGGIGTTSQALAAGVPQLVVAMSHDQPDNGHRIEKLGVGKVTTPKAFHHERKTAKALKFLLADLATKNNCAAVADRFNSYQSFTVACEMIEQLNRVTADQRREVIAC